MAKVLPFKAVRPAQDKVHLVASRSMDGYNQNELKDKLGGNPFTFLHVINPDFDDGIKTRHGSPERLNKVRSKYQKFRKENILFQDEKPAYYIYRQIKEGNTYIGIIAVTSIDDYINGVIKIHEQTLTKREEKLKEYLDVCEFNAEPVLFFYPEDKNLENFIQSEIQKNPSNDFTTTDKLRHTLWVVNEKNACEKIQDCFEKMPAVYIADGHHRSASSALLGKERRLKNNNGNKKKLSDFYLGIFFSENQLKIFDYNRMVKDTNQLSAQDFLKKLESNFEIKKRNEEIFKPEKKHQFSVYMEGSWYSLNAKEKTYNSENPVESLDASILNKYILEPVLNIHDLKTDKRITFLSGVKGSQALKKNVDEGNFKIAFGLFPVTMQHLKWIADTHNIMPPKSTWVEPKMRSGLVIYDFSEK